MEKNEKKICSQCDVALTPMKATFRYLKRSFEHEVLRCPSCGQVYIPEDLAKGRMAQVEASLEEK